MNDPILPDSELSVDWPSTICASNRSWKQREKIVFKKQQSGLTWRMFSMKFNGILAYSQIIFFLSKIRYIFANGERQREPCNSEHLFQ